MKRSRPQPGGDPNRYYPHGGPYRGVSRCSKGQHVLAPGGYLEAGHFPDAPTGGGVLLLDWKDGDGAVPTVWGGAPLTVAGAPTASNRPLPWVHGGTRLDQTTFAAGGSYLSSTDARLDPAGRDFVFVLVAVPFHVANATTFGTLSVAGTGFGIKIYHSGNNIVASVTDTASTTKNAVAAPAPFQPSEQ